MQVHNIKSSSKVSSASKNASTVVPVIKGKAVIRGANVKAEEKQEHVFGSMDKIQAFDFVGIAG